jgi:hypothetical protein
MYVSTTTSRVDGKTMKIGQAGIGIIQVMIAISATAGLTYVMMQQSETTNKQQAKASHDQLLQTQVHEIQTEMAKLENCTATLKGLKFNPTPFPVTSLKKGLFDPTNPENIIVGPGIFSNKKSNSIGIYIQDMNILKRTEPDPAFPTDPTKMVMRDVLRVTFARGDIDSSGNVRQRSKTLGASTKGFDFYIQSTKDPMGNVMTCFADNSNTVANTCNAITDAVWNAVTKKCEFPNAIPRTDLIPLYTLPDGGVGVTQPPPTLLTQTIPIFGTIEVKLSCQCSGKRCSRAPNPCRCTVPSCPSGYIPVNFSNWNREQSGGLGIDKACMYGANCQFVSKPVGYLVKP